MSGNTNRTDDLLSKYLDGLLSDREAQELTDLVGDDPETARDAALSLCVHASLVQELRPAESFRDLTPSIMERVRARAPRAAARRRTASFRWGVWAAVAACLAIVVGSVVYNTHQPATQPEKIVAYVEATSPKVVVTRGDRSIVAVLKMTLEPGDTIVTGSGERIVLAYQGETTRVELKEDARLTLLTGAPVEGKSLRLESGDLTASVATQSPERPMIFHTPHARALVRGTVLSISVKNTSTRLDVTEGRVEFAKTSGRASIDVTAGHYAVAKDGTDLVARPVPGADLLQQLVQRASTTRTVADMKALKDLSRAAYEAELARGEKCDLVRLVYLGVARAIARNPKEDRQTEDLRFILDRAVGEDTQADSTAAGLSTKDRKIIRDNCRRARKLAEELYYDEWAALLAPLQDKTIRRLPSLTEALLFEDGYVTFYERGLPRVAEPLLEGMKSRFGGFPATDYLARSVLPLVRIAAARNRRLEETIQFDSLQFLSGGAWEVRGDTIDSEKQHPFRSLVKKQEDTKGIYVAALPHIPFRRAVLTGQVRLRGLGDNPGMFPWRWGMTGQGALRGQGITLERAKALETDRRWTWFFILFVHREDGRWGMVRWEWLEGDQPHDLTTSKPSLPPRERSSLGAKNGGLVSYGDKSWDMTGHPRIILAAEDASVEWRALGLHIVEEGTEKEK
ncbi:FecR domain-containing protein [Planctomycetota bacterium]